MHRSRVCHFVIDVPDLDQGVWFWSAALNATEETRDQLITVPAGTLPGPAVQLRDVRAPGLDRVDQSFLAQRSDRAPGRGAGDLIRLDQLALGRDAAVRRVLTREDPALDDLRYLPVGRHRAERIDPLSWHMINFRYRSS